MIVVDDKFMLFANRPSRRMKYVSFDSCKWLDLMNHKYLSSSSKLLSLGSKKISSRSGQQICGHLWVHILLKLSNEGKIVLLVESGIKKNYSRSNQSELISLPECNCKHWTNTHRLMSWIKSLASFVTIAVISLILEMFLSICPRYLIYKCVIGGREKEIFWFERHELADTHHITTKAPTGQLMVLQYTWKHRRSDHQCHNERLSPSSSPQLLLHNWNSQTLSINRNELKFAYE